ncbi:MAG: TolC family protein [Planctomycetes bacterium]|nr:TolC family protein [Planctomycetota bacterium]
MSRSTRLIIPVLLLLLVGPGCSRKFFRKNADADVAAIISQKNQFPDWAVKNWFVYPHPDARFADPYNPDRPPYPPDDYAARLLSPNPQHPTKRTGTGRYDGEGYMRILSEWDAENRALADAGVGAVPDADLLRASGIVTASAQIPALPTVPDAPVTPQGKDGLPNTIPQAPGTDPKQPGGFPTVQSLIALGDSPDAFLRALQTNQQGYRIQMEQAVQLGLINSREFQDRREDLYLTALPVTLQRFNFAAQAFFTEQVVRNFTGSNLSGAGRLWSLNTTTGLSKNFATGGQLLVQLANQVVLDLGSGRPNIALSNLTLSAVQPFLRGGGFAVNLEPLTQSERDLLYGMRSYARFRKLFYVATAAGPAGGLGLTNNPYGLQGLAPNLGRGIGGNLTAPVIGYLPLLQQSAVIANQRKNVLFLNQLLKLYEAFREGGQQSDLQVGQVEVQLLTSRGQLLGSPNPGGGGGGSGIRGFLDSLDNFKLQLGLPVTIGLDLDDKPLKPIRDQLARFEGIYTDLAKLEALGLQYNLADPIAQFRPRWRRLLTETDLVRGTTFAKSIGARWDAWASLTDDALMARVADLTSQRTKLLDDRAKRQLEGKPEPLSEIQRLAALEAERDLGSFERAVRVYETRPWLKLGGPSQAAAFRVVFDNFDKVAFGARNERLNETRAKWPDLPPLPVNGVDLLATDLDEAYTAGVQAALSSRLDLMNARGQVVDAYRKIAVQANSLQGVFNVEYDLNAATPATESQPFNFSPSRTRHTLTFTGELPLVRRAERNNYRAALISYQRQRRTLMAFEDNIANDVRNDIRELRTQAQLYKIQQRVVDLGYSQVDNAKELLVAPPPPPPVGGASSSNDAAAAAALTQQLLQAQSNLLSAQNALYTLWVNYMTARMNLYLDLELMQLDDRGVWTDEQITGSDIRQPGPELRPAERLPAPQPVGPADRK